MGLIAKGSGREYTATARAGTGGTFDVRATFGSVRSSDVPRVKVEVRKKSVFEPHDLKLDERENPLRERSKAVWHSCRYTFFPRKLVRLGMGAKVGSYLGVLTAANARGMLRRRARLASAAQSVQPCNAALTSRELRHLQRWEDDGGRVRRAP